MAEKHEQFKVTIKFEKREDGGLRAWSPDVPGLVLSSSDPEKVIADIGPALEVIVGEMLGCPVRAYPLEKLPTIARKPNSPRVARPALAHGRRTMEFAAACG